MSLSTTISCSAAQHQLAGQATFKPIHTLNDQQHIGFSYLNIPIRNATIRRGFVAYSAHFRFVFVEYGYAPKTHHGSANSLGREVIVEIFGTPVSEVWGWYLMYE